MHILLAVSLLLAAPQQCEFPEYSRAIEMSKRESRPLLVIISAKWCASCQVLKRDTIQPMQNDRSLKDCIVTIVDKDEHPELALQLMTGEVLPQIVLFNRPDQARKRFSLAGMQDRNRIVELLKKLTH